MEMKSATCLTCGNLWSKRHIIPLSITYIADDPFSNKEFISCLFSRYRQKFDLILLVSESPLGEVPHLAVSVLNDSTTLGNQHHAARTEITCLGIGCTLVISMLFLCRKSIQRRFDDIIFQFTHCPKIKSLALVKCGDCFPQRIFRCTLQWISIFVKERTKHTQSWNLRKRINECRRETW